MRVSNSVREGTSRPNYSGERDKHYPAPHQLFVKKTKINQENILTCRRHSSNVLMLFFIV